MKTVVLEAEHAIADLDGKLSMRALPSGFWLV